MAGILEKYLKQDLVEEVVLARLSSHVHTSLQLPTTKCHNFSWVNARSTNLWMWYSTKLFITWLVHWFIDSMVLMNCKETWLPFSKLEGNWNDHPEQLGDAVLLALQVVPHHWWATRFTSCSDSSKVTWSSSL